MKDLLGAMNEAEAEENTDRSFFYLKQSDVWTKKYISIAYLKRNEDWQVTDLSVLNSNDKYIIKEVE